MRQRGRKSSASLSVVRVDGAPPRLEPPATLSDLERSIFEKLVAAVGPRHFRPSDLPLLLRYCEACALAERAAAELRQGIVINGRLSPWVTAQEKATRAIVALSLRLRLSPQSRLHPHTVDRDRVRLAPKPWDVEAP